MVSGNLLQLNSQRNEDIYLYGNPQTTYFKKSYINARNFSIEYSKVPLTSIPNFGSVINVEIPKKGDLLAGIYIHFRLGQLTPTDSKYKNGIGHNLIKEVKLTINGTNIQTFNGELIYLINSLNNCTSKQTKYQRMTHCEGDAPTDNSSLDCYLPLPFFFSGNPELYLPVCALSNSRIELVITTETLNNCVINTDDNNTSTPNGELTLFEITTQYIHIGDEEKKMFINASKLDYLIPSYSIGSNIQLPVSISAPTTHYVDIDAKHPTKYILWLVQKADSTDPHDYFDGITHTDILINNTPILENIDINLLSKIQLYERFDGVGPTKSGFTTLSHPTVNPTSTLELYREESEQLYMLNFSLNPSINEPRGTFNLSSFRHKQFKVTVKAETPSVNFRYYTSYFNILVIENGMGGLIYR